MDGWIYDTYIQSFFNEGPAHFHSFLEMFMQPLALSSIQMIRGLVPKDSENFVTFCKLSVSQGPWCPSFQNFGQFFSLPE